MKQITFLFFLFLLSWQIGAQGAPPNDDCANATILTPGGVFADNYVVATNSFASNSNPPSPGCANFVGGDVWFSVTVPASGNLTIETRNDYSSGSQLYDTGLAIYSGNCSNLAFHSCDDDSSSDGNFSLISLTGRTPGEVLYANVWDYGGGDVGTFKISAYDSSLAASLVNDDCANAIALTIGGVFEDNDIIGTNANATNSNPPAPGCASFGGGDVWFSVAIPASGNLTIETQSDPSSGGQLNDTGLAVYSGNCGNLTLVACDDDSSLDGNFSLISLIGRTPGEVLYANVWDYGGGDVGTFKISTYDATLSASGFVSSKFSVYPNPANNLINVSNNGNIQINTIVLMDINGRTVKSLNFDGVTETQINISDLSTGVYFINIDTSGGNIVRKIIKN